MANNRLIVITWTPVVDTNAVGYNVYLVEGAPPTNTKTLIAFVNGVNSNAYNYTAVEGKQYQFEVRATDAQINGNESAPLEIFYPDGRAIATPITGSLTPDGLPMMITRDSQYVYATEFNQYSTGLQFANTDAIVTSGVLDSYLKAASGHVNRFCKRHFDVQTKDEIYPAVRIGQDFPKLMTVFLQEKPVQNIISVNLQVLKYFIPVALDYLQVDPDAGFYSVVPMLTGGYTGFPVPQVIEGMLARVWTRYTFGYDVMPEEIKIATVIIAAKLIALPSANPISAQSVRCGRNFQMNWDKDNDPMMDTVKNLLRPYIKFAWGKPSIPF